MQLLRSRSRSAGIGAFSRMRRVNRFVAGRYCRSLIAELKREDVEIYLQDRRKRGFNAILVNLVEHYFSRDPPANAYGEKPFKGDAFGDLNPKYFDHAAWVIGRAEQLGIVVFLAPAYLGVNGNSQGWFSKAEVAGPQKNARLWRDDRPTI